MKLKNLIYLSLVILFYNNSIFGKIMEKNNLKSKLTKIQYDVTQNCSTEQPFNNAFWDNKDEGIYVDIVSGEVLFCSIHKYDSGTGWPSFYQTVENSIILEDDEKLGYKRIELKSKEGKSHLGHLFNDGPKPTGLRYCINSAALKFIPKDSLKSMGYIEYLYLFEDK